MNISAPGANGRLAKVRPLLRSVAHLSIVLFAAFLAAAIALGVSKAAAQVAPGGLQIVNIAKATYIPAGYTQTETVNSNSVIANVEEVEALTLTADQTLVRAPGSTVTLSHLLANAGNVPSRYTITLAPNGPSCSASALSLSGLRVVRDLNSNGVLDIGDPEVALASEGAVELLPGQITSLLVEGRLPSTPEGQACFVIAARTSLQNQTAANTDTVRVGSGPAIQLTKSANAPSNIVPGQTRIGFTVTANNIGASDALPSSAVQGASGPGTILVNGQPAAFVLIRDEIPGGTQYVPGTLASAVPGTVRLFRYSGDPQFAYRTIEDASAVEVAIGLPQRLVRNGSVAMNFSVLVNPEQSGTILNTAFAYFSDGAAPAFTPSNTVVLASNGARIGLAKQATAPVPGRDAGGALDGTVTSTFSIRIVNLGSEWLYDVQANDVLEGAGASQFGTYTSANLPAVGQYTIVPGSIRLAPTATPGIRASVNPAFTGQPSASALFAPGAIIPIGGEVTIQFDVRANVSGRTGSLLNTAIGTAALVAGGPAQVRDVSTNGINPDPDGDGNPANNSVPTPISVAAPALTLVKTSSLPRRVADGVFEIDYSFRVTNTGTSIAPFVRVIDNLNCTFKTEDPQSLIADWQLVGPVRSLGGVLAPSVNYTGRLPCNQSQIASTDPFDLPTEIALSLTDGTRALAPGQSETLAVTVRVTRKASVRPEPAVLTNKAWAAAFAANTINTSFNTTVAATSATAQSLLIDPSGTVYDSVSRAPIAGALVTYRRESCTSGNLGPITPDQIYNGNSGIYTFNADGTLSMTTGADGAYQFYLKSPPITGLCTYSVKVTPPAGSAYVAPSEIITVTPGTFTTCGPIVPNATPPQGNDPTTHFNSVSAGINQDGSLCEVVNNHVPLDPGNIRGLVLNKGASRAQIEIGDFIDYALELNNRTGFPVVGIDIADTLPAGFAYVPGSSRLTGGTAGTNQLVSDPEGGRGPALTWRFPVVTLDDQQKLTLRYRVRVGVGAPTSGNAVNRATAASGPLTSNLATHTVQLTGGVFSNEAFVFGKVYMACPVPGTDGRRSGRANYAIAQSGEDAPGVPGVRLFLEDGTSVVTDSEGKWSLYGLKPVTRVIRIDETTLPRGAKPVLLDNRNAFDPRSRFVDLKNGELHKADFPLEGCADPEVMAEVADRREKSTQRLETEAEAALRARLDPNGEPFQVGDRRALAASGGSDLLAPAANQQAVAAPLITLPANSGRQDSFISGIGNGNGAIGTLAQAQSQAQSAQAGQSRSAASASPKAGKRSEPRANAGANDGIPADVQSTQGSEPGSPQAPPPLGAPKEDGLDPIMVKGEAADTKGIDLETLLPSLDNTLGFIDLKDGETLSNAVTNIRVKGEAGLSFSLTINGEEQPANRVGKRAVLESNNSAAWEYIGVPLKPGKNTLRLQATDPFGNVRGEAVEITVIAPGRLADVLIDLPSRAYADSQTPIAVVVRLVDADGVPVSDRTQITLEAANARWAEEDLNANEPGSQFFVTGGEGVFNLIPPADPGTLRIRATGGEIIRDANLTLVPPLRPMIGVGIVEGTIDLTNRGKLAVGQDAASRAFEEDLARVGNIGDDARVGGRAAFFFKGTIQGKYLLTAAVDTDKDQRDRLFRDIRPDEFYPIYGDASSRGFDAQSTQRVYVRIDRDRSFLLYGDFISASSPEVRLLSQTNRSLTGLKSVVQTDNLRATSFAANTSQRQQIEEFPGRGISGPYFLSGGGAGNLVENSEKIELLVRDRNQPSIVLRTTSLERFTDYTIEPLTRRIIFRQPISSVDVNLNPQSLRVTYEVDSGGEQYLVAGTDVQLKVGDNMQIGAVATIDNTPDNERKLAGVTVLARLGKHTTLTAESVVTDTALKGTGGAARVELQYQDNKLGIGLRAARTSENFDNPASVLIAGRTEASARVEYRASQTLQLRAEGVLSEDATGENAVRGVTASVQKQFGKDVTAEIGARYGSATSPTASLFDYGQASIFTASAGTTGGAINPIAVGGLEEDLVTMRGRLTTKVPGIDRARIYLEGEQDLADMDRRTVAIGGSYDVSSKTRVYGRYVLDASLNGDFTLSGNAGRNVGVFGVESTVLGNGRLYNEYRIADALDGRTGQNATGLRSTFEVAKNLRLIGGIEYIRATGDAAVADGAAVLGQGNSISFSTGFEYLTTNLKTSGILEARLGQDADTWLGSGGLAYRISDDWSVLARSVYSSTSGKGSNLGNDREIARHQIGFAWRPVDSNVWNGLARYERRTEVIRGGSSEILVGTLSGSSFGTDALLPGTYLTDIFAANLNYNPQPGLTVMGRFAAKFSEVDDGLLKSTYDAQLGQVRVIYDLDNRWDIGVQGALMHGSGGAWKRSLGVEIGRLITKNLWVSGGYNITGLEDRDLTAGEYTSEGAFLRLRFKFGEDTLGFRGTAQAAEAAGALASLPTAPDPVTPQEHEPLISHATRNLLTDDATVTVGQADGAQVTAAGATVEPEAQATDGDAAVLPPASPAVAVHVATESSPGRDTAEQINAAGLFMTGSSTLRGDRLGALDALAARMKAEPDLGVKLVLDTADVTSFATDRARTVALYLRSRGVAAERIVAGGESAGGEVVASVEIRIGVGA